MQRGYNSCLIEHEGQFLGISMGADATSEHEWGIKKLKDAFGVDPQAGHGVSRLVINRVPTGGHGYAFDPVAMTMGCDAEVWGPYGRGQVARLDEDGLACAWCDSAFLIRFDAAHLDAMKQLDAAVRQHDVAFMFLGRSLFSLRGLSLVIVSRLPESLIQKLEADDAHQEWVAVTNAAIGIQERLKAAGCGYYACSPYGLTPEWRSGLAADGRATAHDLIYWLNPSQQDRVNYGYFTVEELDQWIAGTGPVPMQQKRIVR